MRDAARRDLIWEIPPCQNILLQVRMIFTSHMRLIPRWDLGNTEWDSSGWGGHSLQAVIIFQYSKELCLRTVPGDASGGFRVSPQ